MAKKVTYILNTNLSLHSDISTFMQEQNLMGVMEAYLMKAGGESSPLRLSGEELGGVAWPLVLE